MCKNFPCLEHTEAGKKLDLSHSANPHGSTRIPALPSERLTTKGGGTKGECPANYAIELEGSAFFVPHRQGSLPSRYN